MPVINEGKHTGEFLLSEANGYQSRENIVVSSTAGAIVPGTLLGRVTATGEYVAYSNAASDGSEQARGVLWAAAPDLTVDQKAVMIARDAEVIESELTGLDTAARADLAAIGILIRV